MKYRISCLLALGAALAFLPTPGAAQHYVQKNLVSDLALPENADGTKVRQDLNFLNPWGITRSSDSPWWINLNNAGGSSIVTGTGDPASFINEADGTKGNFVVVPTSPSFPARTISNPTGIVFNGSGTDFLMPKGTPAGKRVAHLEHGPWMNSPWGAVWTPRDFGRFSNAILVGNFGSGWIAAFNGFTYRFEGFLKNPDDSLLFIDGLWSLTFGNDGAAGPATTLFFTAGPNGEADGLFGTLVPASGESDGSIE